MQKGITPVVAIILLLLITISIIGFAFMFFGRVTETASKAGEEQLQQQIKQASSQPRIEAASGNKVSVRNTGSSNLENINFYADGELKTISAGPASLGPNQVGEYTLSGLSAEAATVIKVTSGGFGDQTISEMPRSCKGILATRQSRGNGVYRIQPAGSPTISVYCDMTTDGGGWTLVWSNLRTGTGKPVTGITWNDAINTLPRTSGTFGANLEAFNFYLGLKFWEALGSTIRYDWANDYGSAIDQRFYAAFSFDKANNYKIVMSGYQQKIGSSQAGLWNTHNNQQFTTFDADHDTNVGGNCAQSYSNTPWWYTNCWSGSINGGGENSGQGYFNGAYWVSSAVQWGDDAGNGAGNGWIYVR